MSILEVVEVNSENSKGLLEVTLKELKSSYKDLRLDLDFGGYFGCLVSAPSKWFPDHLDYIKYLVETGKVLAIYNYFLTKLKNSMIELLREIDVFGGVEELLNASFDSHVISTRHIIMEGKPFSSHRALAIFDIIRLYYMCMDLEDLATGSIDVDNPPELFCDIEILNGRYWIVEHPMIPGKSIIVSNEANADLEVIGVPLITFSVNPVDIDYIAESEDMWKTKEDIIETLRDITEYCKES